MNSHLLCSAYGYRYRLSLLLACLLLVVAVVHSSVLWAADTVVVGISYDAPHAKSVSVAGSFDQWWAKRHAMKKEAGGRWVVFLQLKPGRYEFQFLVDGKWRYDPRLPHIADSFGNYNNVLILP